MTITELRKLMETATPGPWASEECDVFSENTIVAECMSSIESQYLGEPEATLIAAMRNALPALLEIAEAAQVVSSQRNGPYLMADMDTTLHAEAALKQAIAKLEKAK